MPKLKQKKGFSMGEMMAVVAIMVILAGVGIVAIISYMRSMTKMQYDDYAKEIFIAAQNHLAMAESQGYLGRGDDEDAGKIGIEETSLGYSEAQEGVYVFIIKDGAGVNNASSILNLMLPPGALDETVRSGGSYIVRYHKEAGQVLDVFFWESSGRYAHSYENEYADFMVKRPNKADLKNYSKTGADHPDHSVIGYYGGAEATTLEKVKLNAPEIEVVNADRLYVKVTDTNLANANARLTLEVRGTVSNGVPVTWTLSGAADGKYEVVLDDITTLGKHFCEVCPGMIPGEDIRIRAFADSTTVLANVAYSAQVTTNSLFGNGSAVSSTGTADIANFRHLENLNQSVSDVNLKNTDAVMFTKAKQSRDLSWQEESQEEGWYWKDKSVYYGTGTLVDETASIKKPNTLGKYFLPVAFPVGAGVDFAYDGNSNSISGIVVSVSGSAGLFSELSGGSVKNLKLVDFTITGGNAGALAGSVSGTTVTNVLAVSDSTGVSITGGSSVGGLIGTAGSGSTIEKCAAALTVKSNGGSAGGLIGTVNASTVEASYSAGHTTNGAYSSTSFNITAAGAAGGLVGGATGGTVKYCYSTCSAKGASAGGLAGSVSGGSFTSCYATGLVSGAATAEGAFAGSACSATDCWYFEIVNERPNSGEVNENGYPVNGYTYLGPVPGSGTATGITALDADAATYNDFVGEANKNIDNRKQARPYDDSLKSYYTWRYELKTVAQLGASVGGSDFVTIHYGDWPAPELWVLK